MGSIIRSPLEPTRAWLTVEDRGTKAPHKTETDARVTSRSDAMAAIEIEFAAMMLTRYK